jgi:hypothetical protein
LLSVRPETRLWGVLALKRISGVGLLTVQLCQMQLPTPLRLAVFADSRAGWVVAILSV